MNIIYSITALSIWLLMSASLVKVAIPLLSKEMREYVITWPMLIITVCLLITLMAATFIALLIINEEYLKTLFKDVV